MVAQPADDRPPPERTNVLADWERPYLAQFADIAWRIIGQWPEWLDEDDLDRAPEYRT